jgi:hypothetical protein
MLGGRVSQAHLTPCSSKTNDLIRFSVSITVLKIIYMFTQFFVCLSPSVTFPPNISASALSTHTIIEL